MTGFLRGRRQLPQLNLDVLLLLTFQARVRAAGEDEDTSKLAGKDGGPGGSETVPARSHIDI